MEQSLLENPATPEPAPEPKPHPPYPETEAAQPKRGRPAKAEQPGISGELPARKPVGLAGKIAAIMAELKPIDKGGYNANQKYKFVQASDVAEAIRPLLAKHRVALYQSCTQMLQSAEPTKSGGKMTTTLGRYEFKLVCADTGETETLEWWAEGADTQDKGPNKAHTTARKYFLLALFHATAEETDPDAEDVRQDTKPQAGNKVHAPPPPQQQAPGDPLEQLRMDTWKLAKANTENAEHINLRLESLNLAEPGSFPIKPDGTPDWKAATKDQLLRAQEDFRAMGPWAPDAPGEKRPF